jgi:UDPglucose 6-dehydrogenase
LTRFNTVQTLDETIIKARCKLKITVAGLGYVGLSNAILLAKEHDVSAIDIDREKIASVNARNSPLEDDLVTEYLLRKDIEIKATVSKTEAYSEADFVIVATPTNFNEETSSFDTSSVESVIADVVSYSKNAAIVIKSTVPVGFTNTQKKKYQKESIIFSPEFLREGHALQDNLFPSRIIIGARGLVAEEYAQIIKGVIEKTNAPIMFTGSDEAEAIKLLSNTYLAMRVAFFNEIDMFSESRGLSAKEIIEGISHDKRIGDGYNNPSFGFGGYCLPKDTKQVEAQFNNIPQKIIGAIVSSNSSRKQFIISRILSKRARTVGIYRLIMKSGSDNFREASVIDVIEGLKRAGQSVIIHEPSSEAKNLFGCRNVKSFNDFSTQSDLIIANRIEEPLKGVLEKVYTRDIFQRD